MPVLKKWRIFEREDFTGEAARLAGRSRRARRGARGNLREVRGMAKERRLERERKVAEKKAMKNLLVASSAAS